MPERAVPLLWVRARVAASHFPPVSTALDNPDGLLAAGGDLQEQRLLEAYRAGIFPWYQAGQPILWWCPAQRCVLSPQALHIPRSLRKRLRRRDYRVSFNESFPRVVAACAAPRRTGGDTWLTPPMQRAYQVLHERGIAHSVELWMDGQLAGGLYGLALGRVFCGESMFSARRDASKLALAHLAWALQERDFQLIDCQIDSPFLRSLGATLLPRQEFVRRLRRYALEECRIVWPDADWCPGPLRDGRAAS